MSARNLTSSKTQPRFYRRILRWQPARASSLTLPAAPLIRWWSTGRSLRIARPNELSADRRGSLPRDSGALRILLVPAARTGCVDGRQPEDLGGIRDARRHRWLEIAAARPFQIDTRTRCPSGISCEPALVCRTREPTNDPYRRRHATRCCRVRFGSCVARG